MFSACKCVRSYYALYEVQSGSPQFVALFLSYQVTKKVRAVKRHAEFHILIDKTVCPKKVGK